VFLLSRSGLKTSEGHHLFDVPHVGLVHVDSAAQLAFVLRGLLGQDVAFERLAPFNGAAWSNAKPLGRAFLGLHFGHLIAPFCLLLQAPVKTSPS
jgi:hypothetical protein